jgi:hypothetical protein
MGFVKSSTVGIPLRYWGVERHPPFRDQENLAEQTPNNNCACNCYWRPLARQQRPMVSPPQRIISSRKTLQRTIQTQLNNPSDNRLRFTSQC